LKKTLLVLLTILMMVLAAGCGSTDSAANSQDAAGENGTLVFKANGEDFIRQGFTSKDGWEIRFDHAYITLGEITAYQTDPPYQADSKAAIDAEVTAALEGEYTVDLAEGDENADTILLDQTAARAGFYNAISWKVLQAESGDPAGHSIVITGTAVRDGITLPFNIAFDPEYQYYAGEFIGDERKGILDAGDTADLEMTFHSDHIFGDNTLPQDDGLNTGALGFDAFAALAVDGQIDCDMNDIKNRFTQEDFDKLVGILPTLGHVGEGHAHYVEL